MSYENPIDARAYSYEEWIRFVFDHPVSDHYWYYTEEFKFEYNPQSVLRYYIRLFQEPWPILQPYTDSQLEQGLWFVAGEQLSHEMLCDDENLSVTLRVECIQAMPVFFERFFFGKPLNTICYMWWDLLAHSYYESPNPHIVEAMIDAMERILALPALHCQKSALHGMGHCKHPCKEPIIFAYLQQNPQLDPKTEAYAKAAILSRVQ